MDRLAVGGMAEVFRARQAQPVGEPRLVAIKRMLPDIAAQAGSRAMFEAESHLGALIHHPNVVEVLDVGEEDGQPYLALEYIRGLDLGRFTRFLTREGLSLDLPLAIFVVRQLLAGLHAVHVACQEDGTPLSVVHRDISPSNVLLSKYGDVKLADFGIAFAELQDSLLDGAVTEHPQGKLSYLAPEQVTGGDCDRRADIFSAATIAAELV
ncbi:MAG: serine/threonine protein kinase, partial [Deltaproteobacteria bacterium]|nr:serine/threonine protein kinase [Deltaproteobacteria bacterium]